MSERRVGEDGKNKDACFCRVCGCKVFRPSAASFVEQEFFFPAKKGEVSVAENAFWACNMMDFENIGFTHTKDNIKYLTCADCEREVLGYQDLANTNRQNIFVAVERLLYDENRAKELKSGNPAPSIESLLGNLTAEQLSQLQQQQQQQQQQNGE